MLEAERVNTRIRDTRTDVLHALGLDVSQTLPQISRTKFGLKFGLSQCGTFGIHGP